MHSPVWHAYDVTHDTADIWTEWEYYTDEFFDELGQSARERKRRKTKHSGDAQATVVLQDGDANGLMLRTPTDTDRKGPTDIPNVPIFDEVRQEKVALLKDWRERFKSILPEERTSTPKRLDVVAHGQSKGSKKRKVEDPSNVTDSTRVEASSTNTRLGSKVSAQSSRVLSLSKLRNEVVHGHNPMSPPGSHTEDTSAESSALRQSKNSKHSGGGQSTTFNNTKTGSITVPKAKAPTSISTALGKTVSQKRKTVSDEESPNTQSSESGVYHDRKRKDALSGVRKSKRLKS